MERIERGLDALRASGSSSPDGAYFVLRNAGVVREDAVRVLGLLVERGTYAFPPLTHLELFLTEACNLACEYCFVEGKNDHDRMEPSTAKRAVDFLLGESGRSERVEIVLFGGEPLLAFDTIREITTYARSAASSMGKRVQFDITTNGTLLTDDRARLLAERGVRVLVSMDGGEEVHDTYRRTRGGKPSFRSVLRGLDVLRRYQPHIGVKVTTMPEFAHRLERDLRELASLGIHHFLLGYASGVNWTVEQAEAYAASLCQVYDWWRSLAPSKRPRISALESVFKDPFPRNRHRYGCRAGRSGIAVTCGGEIHPCSKTLGTNDLSGILPLGNLDEGITELDTRMTLCGFIPPDRPGCWSCHLQTNCCGGCYAVNYTTTGSPFRAGPECKIVMAYDTFRRYMIEQERQGYVSVRLDDEVFARSS